MLELRCAGARVIGKAYRQREKFLNERWVYERWVPAIADRAPRLLGADDDAQVSLFSFVEGRPAADESPDLHRRAGRLLRRFHDVEPPVRLDGFLASLRECAPRGCCFRMALPPTSSTSNSSKTSSR